MLGNTKLYLTRRSNHIYYVGWFEGDTRKWKTTKCTTKSDALQYLRNFEGTKRETERTPLLGREELILHEHWPFDSIRLAIRADG